MAGEVAERSAKPGKKGLRRPKRRLSIRIDMTPMVDIAFLLLIFYMVSTVFAMPQAMEINLPPADEQNDEVDIKASNVLSIRVDEDGRYWWNIGLPQDSLPRLLPSSTDKPDSVAYKLDSDTLQSLLIQRNRDNNKLNTLVLIHRDATYADMVDILDEIDFIERQWNAYTAQQLGIEVDKLPKDRKFSYRYAIGDWQPRDDKIISESIAAAMANGTL